MKKVKQSAMAFRRQVLNDYPDLSAVLQHPLDAVVTIATELDEMELGQRGRVGLWREWRLTATKILDVLMAQEVRSETIDEWTARFLASG